MSLTAIIDMDIITDVRMSGAIQRRAGITLIGALFSSRDII